ncbi:hypothetical protein FRB97_004668 [Tulasnella sp. 331]|nr:hypothetical protein FRB97_004668 [Tulasnella sp. 331]
MDDYRLPDHQQPVFYDSTPLSDDELEEDPMSQAGSSYAGLSSIDSRMDESDMGRSEDMSDAAMEAGSVADSEMSSRQTVSTLYPHDSISQRGAHTGYPAPQSAQGSLADIHSFNSDDDKSLHSRLDLQHDIVKFHLRSLYPYPRWVEWLLRPSQERSPAVLDIGTGSGRWAVDMALQFPHAEVLGIDLVPPVLLTIDTIPTNCRFEVDDANLSMLHHKDCFDVVHARSIDQGINDFNGFLYEVAQTIRPHGILILCLGDPQFVTEDLVPFPVTEPGEEGFTWLQKLLYHVYKAFHHRGNYGIDSSIHWKRWLLSNPNYENIQVFDYYIPAGPWKQGVEDGQPRPHWSHWLNSLIVLGLNETDSWVAEAVKINMMHVFEAYTPLLLTDGFSAEDIEVMVKGATAELRDQTIHAMMHWRYITGIRRNAPWHERLEEIEPLHRAEDTLIVNPSPPGTKSAAARSVGFVTWANSRVL